MLSAPIREKLTENLKAEALRLGFSACGISRAEQLTEEARRLEQWLTNGHHGSMTWMENNFEKRIDPRKLVDGAKSVVSVLQNYYHPVHSPDHPEVGRISRYAWGDDYHLVMKKSLFGLLEWLESEVGSISARVFVDSAPVMDKVWAQKSGLGWIGKHSNLISPKAGSWMFIGELIVDVELTPDSPIPDYCGSCTRCIDICPTQAIHPSGFVEATRCISYLTIEHRSDDIPESLQEGCGSWIFGCDLCQDVCPWNKFRKPSSNQALAPREGLPDTMLQEWEELDLESFRQIFRDNPVKRSRFEGFKRNVRIARKNTEKNNRS